MKKQLILAAVAVVAMASCAKNEAVEDSIASATAVKTIELDTFIERSTKGESATTTTLQDGGFNVFCYRHADVTSSYADNTQVKVIMNDAAVEYTSAGAWSYGTASDNENVYDDQWDTDSGTTPADKLSFFAYYPTSLDATGVSATDETAATKVTPSIAVETADTIEGQVDILATSSLDNAYSESPSPIQFEFAHVLSKIGFTAQAELNDSDTGLGIKSVSISVVNPTASTGVLNSGTFYFGDGGATSTGSDRWVLGSSFLAISTEEIASTTIDTYQDGDSGYMELTESLSTNVTDAGGYMMLIPQTIPANSILVKVVYALESDGAYTSVSELNKSVYLPEMTFEMGKQYTFNLILNDNTIRFASTITVSDWVEGIASEM